MRYSWLAMLASLSAAGCAATAPDVLPQFNPANATAGLTDTRYHPVVADYTRRDPVSPQNWRRLNDDLAPKSDGGRQ